MQATRYFVLLLVTCVVLVAAAAGVPVQAADVDETPENHYIAIDLRQAIELVASGDPVVIYFRSPT